MSLGLGCLFVEWIKVVTGVRVAGALLFVCVWGGWITTTKQQKRVVVRARTHSMPMPAGRPAGTAAPASWRRPPTYSAEGQERQAGSSRPQSVDAQKELPQQDPPPAEAVPTPRRSEPHKQMKPPPRPRTLPDRPSLKFVDVGAPASPRLPTSELRSPRNTHSCEQTPVAESMRSQQLELERLWTMRYEDALTVANDLDAFDSTFEALVEVRPDIAKPFRQVLNLAPVE